MSITLNRNKFKYKNPSGSGYRNVDLLEEESKVNDVQVNGTSVVTSGVANIDLSGKADKTDTVLDTTLSRGRKADTIIGVRSFAFGNDVEASGADSHAEGAYTHATSKCAHAEGTGSTASGEYSHAEGRGTVASGSYDHAEGYQSQATGGYAHAEGSQSIASGWMSHAEGNHTVSAHNCTHSEGEYTEANRRSAHAEGERTIANARASHVGGRYNVADSFANWPLWVANTEYHIGDKVNYPYNGTDIGYVCKVDNSDSTFIGNHWTADEFKMNYAEIIGNGSADDARSNAYALDWEGNGKYAGDVYVGANADSSGGSKLARESIIAPAETTTATSAHAIGDKFILDGQLCKATAAIAVGDAITTTGANANAEVTQIVDELGGAVDDVQVNGTSILQNGVANIPYASRDGSVSGVVRINQTYGVSIGQNASAGILLIKPATAEVIKTGVDSFLPIVSGSQHISTFYALAKAAGDTTQAQSSNPVGTYTDDAKTAIKTMLGIGDSSATQIFNEWVDENNDVGYGAEKVYLCSGPQGEWPIVAGDFRNYAANKLCCLYGDTDSDITPLTSFHEDYINGDYYWTAVFDNRVYRSMSGSEYMYSYAVISPDGLNVVEVTSTTPTITAEDNTRYICTNELSTLDISAVDGLSFQVEFYSGSTPTVLTANSLTWPEWFDPDNLEADSRYEVNVVDCFATVAIWHNVSPV